VFSNIEEDLIFGIFPIKVGLRSLTKVGNMLRTMITDHMWSKLVPILKEFKIHFSNRIRIFMEAVFWKLRTGAPWRDLPTEFGSYSTIFNKFNRWSKIGIWHKLFLKMRGELDNEWNFIDSTIVKACQHSVNSSDKKIECIGKAVCGNSSKIHMIADSHGNPIEFILSEGQVHDSRIGNQLIEISNAENLFKNDYICSSLLKSILKGFQMNENQTNSKIHSSILKTCRDGFDKNHHMVTPQAEYSGIGWFLVTFGITTRPVKIKYKCRKCNEIFDESTSNEDLDKNT